MVCELVENSIPSFPVIVPDFCLLRKLASEFTVTMDTAKNVVKAVTGSDSQFAPGEYYLSPTFENPEFGSRN